MERARRVYKATTVPADKIELVEELIETRNLVGALWAELEARPEGAFLTGDRDVVLRQGLRVLRLTVYSPADLEGRTFDGALVLWVGDRVEFEGREALLRRLDFGQPEGQQGINAVALGLEQPTSSGALGSQGAEVLGAELRAARLASPEAPELEPAWVTRPPELEADEEPLAYEDPDP